MATVLLVDDDPLARRVLELHFGREPALKALGARILHASDGRTAMGIAVAEKPQLVVVDLLMPRLDGFGFCRELRATDFGKTTQLLVVSGVYRDPALTSKLLEEVGARFLPKPVAARDFADAVVELLQVPSTPLVEGGPSGSRDFDGPERRPDLPGAPAPELRPALVRPIEPAPEAPPPRVTNEGLGPSSPVEPGTPHDFGASDETRADPHAMVKLAGSARRTEARLSAERTVAKPEETADLAKRLAAVSSGSLAETPLPRLLFDHLEAGSTGTLVVERGRMHKEIFLAGGKALGAESNLRQEAFGAHLVAEKIIDEVKLRAALAEAKRTRKKLGAVLVEMRAMSEEDALRHLEGQAKTRIAASLRWREGHWRFLPGAGFGGTTLPHAVDIERTVLVGLRRSASAETAAETTRRYANERLRLDARGERFRAEFESVFGLETLAAVLTAPRLSLLADRPDADLALAGAEALLLCGMAHTEPATAQASPSTSAAHEPFSLRNLKALAAGAAMAGGFRITLDRPDDSGVVAIGSPAVAAERAEKHRTLLHEALEIHDRSYYDLLGVPPTASTEVIRQAHGVAAARFSPQSFDGLDLGRDAGKLDEVRAVYARALDVLTDPDRRSDYDRRLAAQRVGHEAFDAELAFRDGLDALAAGRAAEAAAGFATALQARPDQAAYHAYLGWTRFLTDRTQVESARAAINEALALDPDLVEGHDFLGRIAAELGDATAAQEHLEKTLLLDASCVPAFDALAALYASAGRISDLERLHRKLLHRLADREPAFRLRLWRQLGDLYSRTLHDREGAQIAYEAASAIAPDDTGVRRRVIDFGMDDPRAWREAARALAAEWRARPVDTHPGHSLMEVLNAAGRTDGAWMAACALALRGLANPEVTAFIERHRPRELPRLVSALDGATLGRVRHPDEDDDIEALMDILARHEIVLPFTFEELGLDESTVVPTDSQPEAFAGLLAYTSAVLGAQTPEVHVRTDLDRDARIADVRPYVLCVGGALLASDDRIELAFRLGRALGFGSAGRVAGASRPARFLRAPLLAALALGGRSDDDAPDAVALRSRIAALPSEASERVREICGRLLTERRTVNLSAWMRALDRTASRIGLLLSGDLLRVGEAVGEEEGPDAVEDLVDFAVSPECSEIRDQLSGREA